MRLASLKPFRDGRLDRCPRRTVVEIETVRGPRGGRIMLYLLSCGHWFWTRGGRPKTKASCAECALETILLVKE